MRPDPHKQAASRKYQNKLRNRGGGTAGATDNTKAGTTTHRGGGGRGGSRYDRGGRGGHHGRSNRDEQEDEEDTKDDGQTSDSSMYNTRLSNTLQTWRLLVPSDESRSCLTMATIAPRKSYARRKIVSNADRYIERDEEGNFAGTCRSS